MSSQYRPVLGVIGESDCSRELYEIAEEVGRIAAGRGAVVACGGLGGVMEAACRGAVEAGGTTIGLLPGTEKHRANQWVSIPIPTGMGEARNVLVVRVADAIVAVGGKFGTLSEIALALKLGKPLVAIQSWGLIHQGAEITPFPQCATAGEAVDLAFSLAGLP